MENVKDYDQNLINVDKVKVSLVLKLYLQDKIKIRRRDESNFCQPIRKQVCFSVVANNEIDHLATINFNN